MTKDHIVNKKWTLLLISAMIMAMLACSTMPALSQGMMQGHEYLYVGSTSNNMVSIIDTSNDTVVKTIDMGSKINGIAADPSGNFVYVACDGGVRMITTADNTMQVLGLPSGPSAIVAIPDGSGYYVLYGTYIDIVKSGSGDVTGKITHNTNKDIMAINPTGDKFCLASTDFELVTLWDIPAGHTYAPQIDFGTANAAVFAPDNSDVYISFKNGIVSAIQAANGLIKHDITMSAEPMGIAVSPGSTTAYVAIPSKNNVAVINASSKTIVGSIPVGKSPQYVVFSIDGKRAYVSNMNDNSISVIDSSGLPGNIGNVTKAIHVDGGPATMAIVAKPVVPTPVPSPTPVPPAVTPTPTPVVTPQDTAPPTLTPTASTPTATAVATPGFDILIGLSCLAIMGAFANRKISR